MIREEEKLMAYPQEVIDYARELYFTPNQEGLHKYSFTEISKAIKQQFVDLPSYPDRSTVARWSTTPTETGKTWKGLWAEGVLKGVIDARKDFDEVQSNEAKLVERIELFNQRLAVIGMDCILKGYKPISGKNFEPADVTQGLSILKTGMDIFRTQTDQIKEVEDKIVNIIIERDPDVDVRTLEVVKKERDELREKYSDPLNVKDNSDETDENE